MPAVWMPPSMHRLQRREAFLGGVAQTLVAGHEGALGRRLLLLVEHRRLDGADLAVEPALGPGLLGSGLRLEAPLVDVVAGDSAALGDPLGSGELVG